MPGIGEQDHDPVQGGVGQGGHHIAGVVGMQPHILQSALLDMAQGRGDAVQEWLAADHQGFGVARRLGRQMFAAAEADLQPDRRRFGHQGERIDRAGFRIGQGDAGQQGVEQGRLPRLDGARLDATERAEGRVGGLVGRGHEGAC